MPGREVPITEAALAPDAPASYLECETNPDVPAFDKAIQTGWNDCSPRKHFIQAHIPPTAAEQVELCSCQFLISKLIKAVIPRCNYKVNDNLSMRYAAYYSALFGSCDLQTTPTTTTSPPSPTTTTTTTTPTTTTTTPTKTTVPPTTGITTTEPPSLTATTAPTTALPNTSTSSSGLTDPSITTELTISPDPTSANNAPPSASGASSTATTSTSSASSNLALVVGSVVGGLLVVVVILALVVVIRRRQNSNNTKQNNGGRHASAAPPRTPVTGSSSEAYTPVAQTPGGSSRPTTTIAGRGRGGGLWEDPVVASERIPFDAIIFGRLVGQGGLAQVYQGSYMGQSVAIKQLVPARRHEIDAVNRFLTDVQLLSSCDHERIVHLVGVAWTTTAWPTDVCIVTEYLANGDLGSVLTHWAVASDRGRHGRPQQQGFGGDSTKFQIALHVAHALTYLHSLQPLVVHGNLKSSNIVLSDSYDAKLTGFGGGGGGGGYGTGGTTAPSLWMAPEVLRGERYDDKADVFSFGVILSELDTHKRPYSHAKSSELQLLEQIATTDQLSVQFSPLDETTSTNNTANNSTDSLLRLGLECVARDPNKRPSASEVLYRIHLASRPTPHD